MDLSKNIYFIVFLVSKNHIIDNVIPMPDWIESSE